MCLWDLKKWRACYIYRVAIKIYFISNDHRVVDIILLWEMNVCLQQYNDVVFGTVAYFVFVYVLMPGYEHKRTQRTDL